MILALDVGNTNIVIGCLDGENIYFEGRLSTDREKTEMEYAVMFKNILDIYGVDISQLDGAVISSVVPPLTAVLKQAVLLVTGYAPTEVSIAMDHGIKLDVERPEQVGNDLIVSAVAALDKFLPPLVIIDMGTATTISVLDQNGVFCGRSILPGVKISQDALSAKTSLLPNIGVEPAEHIIGRNTVDSMKSGMIYGNAAMLDGMIDRIEDTLGQPVTAIATGGLAGAIIPYCKREIILDDTLLLKGLWLIHQRVKAI